MRAWRAAGDGVGEPVKERAGEEDRHWVEGDGVGERVRGKGGLKGRKTTNSG